MNSPDPLAPLRSRKPPETLFHYTTAEGIKGIIENREVWATSILFMNDSQEYREARKVAETHFRRLGNASEHPSADEITRRLAESLERIKGATICVFSLSEEGNQLSQWRAYCPTNGFALGFDSQELRAATAPQGFDLVPCVYTNAEHRALVDPIVEAAFKRFLEELRSSPADLNHVLERVISRLFQDFWTVAPAVKNSAFSEEKEWRLVSIPVGTKLHHRVRGSLLVPYFPLSLENRDGNPAKLNEIVCGPSPLPELRTPIVSSLLTRTGYPKPRIRPSYVPFREM